MRECSRVQVLRPSSSTSGGQSEGAMGGATAADAEAAVELLAGLVDDLIIANQSAEDVHVRQLQKND